MSTERELLRRLLESNMFDSGLTGEELLAQPESIQNAFNWAYAPVICEINGYIYYLGPEADKELNWADAKAWCESVGGELPPRDILLHAYLNGDTRKEFARDRYWSSTEYDSSGAWYQFFNYGSQASYYKDLVLPARAVRACDVRVLNELNDMSKERVLNDMTIRDRFAGLAMQGSGGDSHEAIARESYKLADAMLKARVVDYDN